MNATVGGLFDGCGLLAYGLHLAGWEHIWLCEVDAFRRELLGRRWPGVRIYDDVRAVDARAEQPTLIAGGFPCKGASTAGLRNGFDHPETILWREMARAIGDIRPRYVLVENVANLLAVRDGAVWGEVVGDLAALGYDTVWDCIPAAAFGAPHLRDRVLAVATDTAFTQSRRHARQLGQSRGGQDDRGGDQRAIADASGERRRLQLVPESGRSDSAEPGSTHAAPADADGRRRQGGAEQDIGPSGGQPASRRDDSDGRGVRVEWGDFGAAIRRWEAVQGPAPEPLVRRVDDRRASRVERSRLSALGDGVQVQLGQLAGEYILGLERERLAA